MEVETRVERLAPVVRRMAHQMMRMLPASVELDDLIQAGMMGLLDAARRYQDAHGARFETYATQRIRGAMLDGLRHCDWLPRALRSSLRRAEDMTSRLEQTIGRPPSEAELAGALGMSLGDYQRLLYHGRGHQIVSYEDFGTDQDEPFMEIYCTGLEGDPLNMLEDRKLREALVEAIEELSEREKLVMSLCYDQEFNLREASEVLGVTESRVSQMRTQTIARLRERLHAWRKNGGPESASAFASGVSATVGDTSY